MESISLFFHFGGMKLEPVSVPSDSRQIEFFPRMTDWQLKTEYPIDVGSGICIGIAGRSGADIDSLCFKFINTIKSTKLTKVYYPTLHDVIPNVAVEEIKAISYTNKSSQIQEYKIETSKTITKKSSWSVTNKLEFSFSMEVKAGIPEVVEVSAGFGFQMGTESSYGLENTEEKTELFSFPLKVSPGKAVDVNITIG